MSMNDSINDRRYANYVDVASDSDAEKKTAIRVNDATVSTNKLAISAESVAFSAGAAGTTGVVCLDKAPVYNVDYGKIGCLGDTSFAWVTGTVLTTEVAYSQHQTDAEQLADLSNGEFAIDYDLGRIRYCKATTGTSDTCNYGSRQLNVELTGTSTITVGAVKIEDGDSSTRMDVITQDAAFGTATNGLAVFGKYQATPTTYSDNDAAPILLDANGRIVLSSDIEIGSVELKDASTDTRANILAANTARTTATVVLASQLIGADGTVPPTGSLNSNAPFSKLTDGTSNLTLGTGTVKTVPSQVHDGTTGAVVETAGTKKALNVNITDGTNDMPTMDASARAGFQQISDGTNEVDVIATINSLKADVSSVGGEVVVADNGAGSGVTKTLPIGGKYNAASPTYTDGDVAMAQMDINGNLKTVTTGDIPTTLAGGSKTVAVAGTAEALGASLATKSIYIRAKSTNTSFVCVGDSNVDEATNQQVVLYANDFITIDIANRATVYVDADVGTEGVDYLCMS